MRTLYLPIGVQASGKTTWAKELCNKINKKQNNRYCVLISRDEYRDMLSGGIENYVHGSKYSAICEKMITDAALHQATLAAENNMDIVIADMNLNNTTVRAWEQFAKKHNMQVHKHDFYVEWLKGEGSKYDLLVAEEKYLEMVISRDLQRPNSIGAKVITETFNKYIRTTLQQHKHVDGLPSAVVFDVDGTLAHMQGRKAYEWKKVGEDTVDDAVARLLRMHKNNGDTVIVLSGRSRECEPETTKWLKDNNLPYDFIWMRDSEDRRKDSVVKDELFNSKIEGNFNVHCVYDDRDCVVSVWRRKGVKCLQCEYGDF